MCQDSCSREGEGEGGRGRGLVAMVRGRRGRSSMQVEGVKGRRREMFGGVRCLVEYT